MEVVGSYEPTPDVALELEQEKQRIRNMIETSFERINPRYALALRTRLLEEKAERSVLKY